MIKTNSEKLAALMTEYMANSIDAAATVFELYAEQYPQLSVDLTELVFDINQAKKKIMKLEYKI